MYGSEDVTGQCTYTVAKSDTLTGAWDSSKRQYTVTGLTDDTGWVDITAVYLDNLRITKRFSVSKVYNGQSGVTYGLITSSPIIKKTSQSELTPTYVDFTAYYTVGKDMTKYALNGRFVIEEVLNDDGVWRTVYTSTQDESEVRRSLYTVLTAKDGKVPVSKDGKYALGYPRNVTSIRCRFYAAGGTTQLLGEQTCAVVADATAQLSQSDIVEILSDGGRWNGLYYKNGKLYISFSAALGGELTLGGANNGNGLLRLIDENGNSIAVLDSSGASLTGQFVNRKGKEWIKILDSIITSGYDEYVDGRIDLSAQYSGGKRKVVVESLTSDLVLKSASDLVLQSASGKICTSDGRLLISTDPTSLYITKIEGGTEDVETGEKSITLTFSDGTVKTLA